MPAAASNFDFLRAEWPEISESASKAENLTSRDPRTSCFYARRALELAAHWLYKSDATLKLPHSESLSALIFEPTFRDAIGSARLTKARIIKDLGNLAVHSHKPIREADAVAAVRELFHFCFWIARTYARGPKPPDAGGARGAGARLARRDGRTAKKRDRGDERRELHRSAAA